GHLREGLLKPMDKVSQKVTAIIKTFERPEKVICLHKSIRKFYPHLRVIIIDDSKRPINYAWDNGTEYTHTSYDIGLSAGRNMAVGMASTPYVLLLDDDFLFTEETKIEFFIDVLDSTGFHIVAGNVLDCGKKKLIFRGMMNVKDNILYLNSYQRGKDFEGHIKYDFVLNFFLARTKTLLDYPWDDALKIREHEAFFWNLKQHNIPITAISNVSISHFPTSDIAGEKDEYFVKRVERMKYYHALACQKIGVNDFRSLGAKYQGIGIKHFLIYIRLLSEEKSNHSIFWNIFRCVFSFEKNIRQHAERATGKRRA
ncbi:MAG TPA: glycosyltransferase, partial [Alphaproteobacteria bacterium]|nr:glycosyltransferase [Alphaproteobacteria bacterium]